MFNHLVNYFYTRFLFKIDALPQVIIFPLDIAENFFDNLSTNVRDLFISEGVQVPPRPPNETNHQGNQRLFLVINTAVEAKNNTRTIKAWVQPEIGSCHPRIFMIMLGLNPSIKIAVFCSSFQSE